jgi:predicted NAD/FAD-binding protein
MTFHSGAQKTQQTAHQTPLGPIAPQSIAVIGSGIAGLSAAWLLSRAHRVMLYEKEQRLGGHSNTVEALGVPVDTGFIVYNEANYPNLMALFDYLGVATKRSDMSFGVSLNGGAQEYSTVGTSAFLNGGKNLLRPRFWSMTWDLLRFYGHTRNHPPNPHDETVSLGDYLAGRHYGEPFQRDHLLPQAAAIWSASLNEIQHYPACAFVRFFENHGLLKLKGRPKWRTVDGGSRAYVKKISESFAPHARIGAQVVGVRRDSEGAWVRTADGDAQFYDRVVIAAHADEALAMLDDPSAEERTLLGAFRYSKNLAVLHSDPALMPRQQALWASWNYVGENPEGGCVVSYWMNNLQKFETPKPVFLTLNPQNMPCEDLTYSRHDYEHPLFNAESLRAQRQLWRLQGKHSTWFCGAYFGAGFHEDGLQAGLAAAESAGGVKRPWSVEDESGRIFLPGQYPAQRLDEAA